MVSVAENVFDRRSFELAVLYFVTVHPIVFGLIWHLIQSSYILWPIRTFVPGSKCRQNPLARKITARTDNS